MLRTKKKYNSLQNIIYRMEEKLAVEWFAWIDIEVQGQFRLTCFSLYPSVPLGNH
jgi:hypothetical protein